MSIRVLPRSLLVALALVMCLMALIDRSSLPLPARAESVRRDESRRAAPDTITFMVNSPSDAVDANPGDGKCETAPGNGVCTLRAAIMEANHTPGGGATVEVPACACLYQLTLLPAGMDDETNGDLNIMNTMTIVGGAAGNDAAHTIIDGNGSVMNDRVLKIENGTTVTVTGVTIQNGNCACNGGGIYNIGTLKLINTTLSGNITSNGDGGGLYNGSEAILIDSTLSGNLAPGGEGGGIMSIGDVQLIKSTLKGNRALSGGGVESHNAMTLNDSTLSGNVALDSDGGGIRNIGIVFILNSTISGNTAAQNGGGISTGTAFDLSTVNVYNSTITLNQADADLNGSGTGGGVLNGATGTFTFQNTILAANSESAMLLGNWIPVIGDCAGTVTSGDNNLMENYDTSRCTVNGATPSLTDPQLGPLANNGGATQTHALLPGSPAIDAGSAGGCRDALGALLAADQRGFPRPAFGGTALRCDIGAFEYYAYTVFLPLIQR